MRKTRKKPVVQEEARGRSSKATRQSTEDTRHAEFIRLQETAGNHASLQSPARRGDRCEKPGGIPDPLRSNLEVLSGVDLTDVRVHTSSTSPARLNALAYTQGSEIYLGPGQDKHLPHEAWHAVQQLQGRVKPRSGDRRGAIERDPRLEREADTMGGRASIKTAPSFDGRTVNHPDLHSLPPSLGRAPIQLLAVSDSARFGGDKELEKVFNGTKTIGRGSRGTPVVKIQQALIDMGYTLPIYGVDGKYEGETATAVKEFQRDEGIPENGTVDKTTLDKMQEVFNTRKPYTDASTFDPADPGKGTRPLSAAEKTAVKEAMVPARGVGGVPAAFTETVGGKKYGDEIKARLGVLIPHFHTALYASKEPLRADPTKMFSWTVIERPAKAAKEVTDAVYGTYATKPALTSASGTLIDQWADEEARNAALTAAQKKDKATQKVWYLINSNCSAINRTHGAVPSAPTEKAILTPVVESFVNTASKVQKLLEIDIGWEGAALQGVVYLQLFKKPTDDKNRELMWELFHTCIHEYIHTLAHPSFKSYAETFWAAGDRTRYNTLTEGFADFFTENVRKTVTITTALRKKVEGEGPDGYYDPLKSAPVISPPTYPSMKQAEQVVAIVGIRNAQSAYFRGEVDKIGGP